VEAIKGLLTMPLMGFMAVHRLKDLKCVQKLKMLKTKNLGDSEECELLKNLKSIKNNEIKETKYSDN